MISSVLEGGWVMITSISLSIGTLGETKCPTLSVVVVCTTELEGRVRTVTVALATGIASGVTTVPVTSRPPIGMLPPLRLKPAPPPHPVRQRHVSVHSRERERDLCIDLFVSIG